MKKKTGSRSEKALRTRIKFCGMRRREDVELAVGLGVDAIGFVLVPKSRRYVGAEQAATLRRALPPFVAAVALFQDADPAFVQQAIDVLQPDLLQFHGSESPGYCESFELPYLKAVAMAAPTDLARTAARFRSAKALLLDGHAPGEMGGSGKPFDWKKRLQSISKPIVLAGGLAPPNVATAIRQLRPFAVDVSSGIEREPGIKDAVRMRAFVAAVRRADGRP